MILFPAPADLNGDALAAEITAGGFHDVHVSFDGGQVAVTAAELVDPMPTPEEREAAMEAARQAALAKCIADGQTSADAANANAVSVIGAIVAAHVAPPPPPPPTPAEKLAALGLTADDLKALLA